MVAIGIAGIGRADAQMSSEVRDRVLRAAVQLAIAVDITEHGVTELFHIPVGSGTVISPNGLVLTNWHVVDQIANRAELDRWEAEASAEGQALSIELTGDSFVVLVADPGRPPRPAYVASIAVADEALDLAVLRIDRTMNGPTDDGGLNLPFVPVGNSEFIELSDPLDIFSFPAIGGDTLTYTTGVVSGFNYEDGIEGPAWITTDATLSGGSSGGTAINRDGFLIGVPTQGSSLDCRPGDVNADGSIDAADVGCIPTGGSIGQVRPINLALPLLRQAGFQCTPYLIYDDLAPGAPPLSQQMAANVCTDGSPTPTPSANTEGPSVSPDRPSVERPDAAGLFVQLTPTPSQSLPVRPEELIDLADYGRTSTPIPDDYCLSSPVYAVGAIVQVVAETYIYDDDGEPNVLVRPTAQLRITGPLQEMGVCDRFPIEPVGPTGLTGPSSGSMYDYESPGTGAIDETAIRPA
jgi:S1-C subfamily serine protease